jgi:hypothetical protein
VHHSYRKIAHVRAHLARTARRCRRHSKVVRVHRWGCHHVRRRIARLRIRRKSLMHRARRCASESAHCVKRVFKHVLRLNRRIRKHASKCHVHLPHHVKRSLSHLHLTPVYSATWRNAFLCDDMRLKFKRWIQYQNLRRNALHAEACQCHPLDTSCLRFTFTQIVHVQQKIARARTQFAEQLRACDECAPIKLQFTRWMRRARHRRLRAHNSLCRCRPEDVDCNKRRYARIVRIQNEIRKKTAMVKHLHGDCHAKMQAHGHIKPDWHKTSHAPTSFVAPASLPPGIFPSVARFSGASMMSVSTLILAAFCIIAALF